MRKFIASLVLIIAVGGCTTESKTVKQDLKPEKKPETMHFTTMKVLPIRWQRLVAEEGQTCERCETTGKEIAKAFQSLKEAMAHLGIEVTLRSASMNASIQCALEPVLIEENLPDQLDAQVREVQILQVGRLRLRPVHHLEASSAVLAGLDTEVLGGQQDPTAAVQIAYGQLQHLFHRAARLQPHQSVDAAGKVRIARVDVTYPKAGLSEHLPCLGVHVNTLG